MESKDENVALKATNSILDRAFGKPAAPTVNTNRDRIDYSIADLVAIAYQGGAGVGVQTIEGTAEERGPSSIAAK
jgi:hypothetical protein